MRHLHGDLNGQNGFCVGRAGQTRDRHTRPYLLGACVSVSVGLGAGLGQRFAGGEIIHLLYSRFPRWRSELGPCLQLLLIVESETQGMINRVDFFAVKVGGGVPTGMHLEISAVGIPGIGDGPLAIHVNQRGAEFRDYFRVRGAHNECVHGFGRDWGSANQMCLATRQQFHNRSKKYHREKSDGFHNPILGTTAAWVLIEKNFTTLPESI